MRRLLALFVIALVAVSGVLATPQKPILTTRIAPMPAHPGVCDGDGSGDDSQGDNHTWHQTIVVYI